MSRVARSGFRIDAPAARVARARSAVGAEAGIQLRNRGEEGRRAVRAHGRATGDIRPRVRLQSTYPSLVIDTVVGPTQEARSAARNGAPAEHFPLARRDISFTVSYTHLRAHE